MPLYKLFILNSRVALKVLYIIVNPISFAFYLLLPREKKTIKVRTPIGKVDILLRNRQSARTLYSIFIREDYLTDNRNKNILDLGSNIGISALYFLSRNIKNEIICFEPDPNNSYYLQRNLERFKERSKTIFCAIGSLDSEGIDFNISKDGKHSSFKEIGNRLTKKVKVKVISVNNALKKAKFKNNYPLLLKIDIEGLEKEVISNIDFLNDSFIKELIVEGTGNKDYINKESFPEVINGFIEKFRF